MEADHQGRRRRRAIQPEKDPGETKNLIHDKSEEVRRVIEELHAKIVARMREIRDPALELTARKTPRRSRRSRR